MTQKKEKENKIYVMVSFLISTNLIIIKLFKKILKGDQGSGLHLTRNGKTHIVGINTLPRSYMLADSLREFCTTGSYATRLSTYKEFLDKHAGDYCE